MLTLEYRTDEATARRAMQAQFRQLVGRRWIGGVGLLLIALTASLVPGITFGRTIAICAYGGLLILSVAWVKTYRTLMTVARDQHRQLEDPVVRVELSDAALEVRHSNGSRRTRWSDITRHVRTADFQLFYSGQVAVAMLPSAALTPEAEAFLSRRLEETRTR
jgi:hypothetical protein